MRRVGSVAIAIACMGCGRIGFDPSAALDAAPDVVGGHDEDGDGVADAVDVCPHVAGSQEDMDGDKVGDDCDPEPMNPRQSLLVFETLESGPEQFIIDNGTWTQEVDAFRYPGTGPQGRLVLDRNVGDFRMVIGLDIIAIIGGASAQKQLGIGAFAQIPEHYFAELNELPGFSQAAVTETDGASYNSIVRQGLVTGLHTGRVVLEVTQLASTQTVSMDGGWSGESYPLTTPAPFYAGGTGVQIFSNSLLLDLEFIWIIAW